MASTFYSQMASVADTLLQQFGMAAVLRRATDTPTDRACQIAIVDYEPRPNDQALANPTNRRVLMSAITPTIAAEPPDYEQDVLVTLNPDGSDNQILHFAQPVKIYSPANTVVLYEFTVTL